jgi:hypothetical protein
MYRLVDHLTTSQFIARAVDTVDKLQTAFVLRQLLYYLYGLIRRYVIDVTENGSRMILSVQTFRKTVQAQVLDLRKP